MPFAARNNVKSIIKRPAVRWDARCPRCHAKAGSPCRNAQDQPLIGTHIERASGMRREIRAALAFYAGMGMRTKDQGSEIKDQKTGAR